MTTTTENPISIDQLADWLGQQTWSDFASDLYDYYLRRGTLTEGQYRAAFGMWTKLQARQTAAAAPVAPGFYLVDTTVYKVKTSKSGNLYAMARNNGEWEYKGAPHRFGITADHAVTPEVAAQYGAATGICLFCQAELDDQDGLGKIVGVGPVCARKHLNMTQRQLAARLGLN